VWVTGDGRGLGHVWVTGEVLGLRHVWVTGEVLGLGHVWVTGEVRTGFWWGNLKEKDNLETLGFRWWYNIKMDIPRSVMGRLGLDLCDSG